MITSASHHIHKQKSKPSSKPTPLLITLLLHQDISPQHLQQHVHRLLGGIRLRQLGTLPRADKSDQAVEEDAAGVDVIFATPAQLLRDGTHAEEGLVGERLLQLLDKSRRILQGATLLRT